jgi:hypothetical protein
MNFKINTTYEKELSESLSFFRSAPSEPKGITFRKSFTYSKVAITENYREFYLSYDTEPTIVIKTIEEIEFFVSIPSLNKRNFNQNGRKNEILKEVLGIEYQTCRSTGHSFYYINGSKIRYNRRIKYIRLKYNSEGKLIPYPDILIVREVPFIYDAINFGIVKEIVIDRKSISFLSAGGAVVKYNETPHKIVTLCCNTVEKLLYYYMPNKKET